MKSSVAAARRRLQHGEMMRLLLLLVLGFHLVAGCGPQPRDPAVEAFEHFISAVLQGDAERVWDLLTPSGRRELARKLGVPDAALAKDAPDRLAVRPDWRFELGLPKKARLDPDYQTADRKVVVFPIGGNVERFVVARVGDEWLLDLFADPGL